MLCVLVLVSLQLTVFSAAELLGGACPMYSWSSQAYKLFCLSRIPENKFTHMLFFLLIINISRILPFAYVWILCLDMCAHMYILYSLIQKVMTVFPKCRRTDELRSFSGPNVRRVPLPVP